MIITPRLRLHAWSERHLAPFVAMHADAEVMRDYGGPIQPEASLAKFARYRAVFDEFGFGRWAIEKDGDFVGYAGVTPSQSDHPLGRYFDMGWRLIRAAWGQGYATEAARASLADFFGRELAVEVLAYTGPDNVRSQAVMRKLGMARDASRDFSDEFKGCERPWLVWVARP